MIGNIKPLEDGDKIVQKKISVFEESQKPQIHQKTEDQIEPFLKFFC